MKLNLLTYLDLNRERICEDDGILIQEADRSFTWREVREKATLVAASIVEMGIWQEPVCIEADQKAETLILMLGIVLSGNYYIPMSPDLPQEKKQQIWERSEAKLYCTPYVGAEGERIPVRNYQDMISRTLTRQDEGKIEEAGERLDENSMLYVIFTSGSTGEPKGIVKTHRSMISFLDAYVKEFAFTRKDVLGSQTPFYFDASSKDIYLMFLLKCKLFIIPQGMFVRPAELVEYLNREKVTVIQWVPSALSILSRILVFKKIKPLYLKKVFFVGEVFPVKQLKIWMEYLPETDFFNLYGASELAGICAYYSVKETDGMETIPMGKPLSNCEIHLVSDGHVVTQAGVVGEIYIKSEALAAGYLKDVERTKDSFHEQPAPELPTGRYYQSGDLARYLESGELDYVSRKDFQIKHMGHRIELGEIEAAACEISSVGNACCVYVKNKIVLFYEGCIQKGDLLTYLKARLLPYMIPNKVVVLDTIPLNANGKINRISLKESLL